MTRHPNDNSWRSGFTIVEMLVVLSIIAITSTVVLLNIRPASPKAELNQATLSIGRLFQEARNRSILQQRSTLVTFDIATRTLKSESLKKAVSLPADMEMKITAATNDDQSNSFDIRFYPDGSSSGVDVLLSLEETNRSLKVNWLTGLVTINDG